MESKPLRATGPHTPRQKSIEALEPCKPTILLETFSALERVGEGAGAGPKPPG